MQSRHFDKREIALINEVLDSNGISTQLVVTKEVSK